MAEEILIELVVNRRFRGLSPFAQRAFVMARELLRIAVAVIAGVALFRHVPPGLAAGLSLGVLWLLVEPWRAASGPGTSRILLTDTGIHVIEDGLSCEWEDVAFHATTGDVLYFEPKKDAAPPRLFRSRRRAIPLGREARSKIQELFATRAGVGSEDGSRG